MLVRQPERRLKPLRWPLIAALAEASLGAAPRRFARPREGFALDVAASGFDYLAQRPQPSTPIVGEERDYWIRSTRSGLP